MNRNCRITVIGGGNIGTYFACTCAAKGYAVTVFSSKPRCYGDILTTVDGDGNIICEGKAKRITSDLATAMDADVIFVTHPAHMLSALAKEMEPYVKDGTFIGVIPGTGGAEFAFQNCMKKGAVLFGIQRVPCVARLIQYGKTVCAEGKRSSLYLASIPTHYAAELSEFMSQLFDMVCNALPNYLCVTMTPSNPILHTTRLRTLFADYQNGVIYFRNPLFYEEWSDESSELLFACDEEHQRLCQALSQLDLSTVRSLKEHYESATPEALTQKIRSIPAFRGLFSPMKSVDGGFVPDFQSRYFTADFPYGLDILIQLATLAGVSVPHMEETSAWYHQVSGNDSTFHLNEYGVCSLEALYAVYSE